MPRGEDDWGRGLSGKEHYLLYYVVSFARVWQTFVPSWQDQSPWGGSGGGGGRACHKGMPVQYLQSSWCTMGLLMHRE